MKPVVGVVAPSSAVQLPVERASRQVPGLCDPCRDPSARRLELRARRASLDAWHTVAIWPPGDLESQTREAPPPARMNTTEAQEVGFSWGDLEVEWRQPTGSHPITPRRLVLIADGTAPVISIAAPPCLAATVRLHRLRTPHVQRVMPIHMRQDG